MEEESRGDEGEDVVEGKVSMATAWASCARRRSSSREILRGGVSMPVAHVL